MRRDARGALAVPGSPAAPPRLADERRDLLPRLSRHGSALRPERRRGALAADVGGRGPLRGRRRRAPGRDVRRHAPAAEHLRLADTWATSLQLSLEDTLVRWHRMRGFDTLFQPGYDHAGISTRAAIGRTAREGGEEPARSRPRGVRRATSRTGSRDYGGTIMAQFRRVGASLDYGAHALHDGRRLLRAVMRWFVHLYRPRLDLPRQPDRQLVPARPNGALRPRGRARGGRRHALVHPLPARRRLGPRDDRDRAAGDDPRRRRGRRAPGRRALPRRSSARRSSSRSSSGGCRSSRTSGSIPSSAPARSRSRPATTRWTSRSAATTGCPS